MPERCLGSVGSCGLEGLDWCGTGSRGRVGPFAPMDGGRKGTVSGPVIGTKREAGWKT